MERHWEIEQLMVRSGVGFGTSGARGTVAAMTDEVCYAYTLAFLQHLEQQGQTGPGKLAIAGDLRSSTVRIMAAVATAARSRGYQVINSGFVPSPALALYGMSNGLPAIMVTGSHIPDDRNGLKFNTPSGEILKSDETAIRAQMVAIPASRFDRAGSLSVPPELPKVDPAAFERYVRRYLDFFPAGCLDGFRVGIYEHSSVASKVLKRVLTTLGAEVIALGYSERFVPVDTEAIRAEDRVLARRWSTEYRLDSVVSTDGDGDRPMVSDENGDWIRGDVAGILCARYLGADTVVTPVSSNTAVEKTGAFSEVLRTRIGSPFVIEAMNRACREGAKTVVGYEANGGFLTATRIDREERSLSPLPTRDAVIVVLILLRLARESGGVSRLVASLPDRHTASDRIQGFPAEWARLKLDSLSPNGADDPGGFVEIFGIGGSPVGSDITDGLRVTFENGEIIHLRPSGNAPEIRCYVESDSEQRSARLLAHCLRTLESWKEDFMHRSPPGAEDRVAGQPVDQRGLRSRT
ncbi:phosphomannomutase [Thiohalomonas denitrificans]|uniref:Phosphomannomutase n=2 Tax=Thiohalomonas denitrificans TaxID=415747 RepID=A0A1G5Q2G1_9GAMM|nr:phosphomannomutase [Thiohalomonas denitrificans]